MSPTATNASGVYPEDTPGLVCLPPISDDLQLIWTQAELTSELDDHPQLIHTFSYFPYPTMPEIALLCLRYGLQMEKVKAWFMVQRIRCGISWSSEEIEETRSRLLYNQDQLHFKPLIAVARKSNVLRNLEKPPAPSPKCEMEQMIPHSPCLPSDDVAPHAKKLRLNERTPETHGRRTTELVNVMKTESSSYDSTGTYRHCKTTTDMSPEPHQVLRNQVKHPAESRVFAADDTEKNSSVPSTPTDEEVHKMSLSWSSDDYKVMQAHGSNEVSGGALREDYYTRVIRRQRKTKEQLAILKSFFLQCQWARREDYKNLEEITGLPRSDIIQWFGDTRYALKHGQLRWFRDSALERPKWLDEPQHVVNQNGRHEHNSGEHNSGEYEGVTLAPDLEAPESENRPAVKVLLKSSECSMGGSPVIKLTEPRSPCSGKTMQKVPEIHANKYATSSGTPNSAHKLKSPSTIITSSQSEPSHQDHILSASQKKYDVLDRYWCTHQRMCEEDLHSLIRKSGLSRKEILDWFCQKSKEPAEVEVCLDEEDDVLADEEDEVVIIQD